MSAQLQVSDYSLTDGGRFAVNVPALRLFAGQTVALYGPSGWGKTSVLVSIFGLLERNGWKSSGSVRFRDRSVAELSASDLLELRRHEVAFLMQDAHAALDPLVAVVDNLLAIQDSRALGLLVATHDESLAAAISHRQLTICEGQLCET